MTPMLDVGTESFSNTLFLSICIPRLAWSHTRCRTPPTMWYTRGNESPILAAMHSAGVAATVLATTSRSPVSARIPAVVHAPLSARPVPRLMMDEIAVMGKA